MSEVTHRLTQKPSRGKQWGADLKGALQTRARRPGTGWVVVVLFVCFTGLLEALDGGTNPQTEGHEGCFPFSLAQKLGCESFWAWRAVEHPPAKLT